MGEGAGGVSEAGAKVKVSRINASAHCHAVPEVAVVEVMRHIGRSSSHAQHHTVHTPVVKELGPTAVVVTVKPAAGSGRARHLFVARRGYQCQSLAATSTAA